MTKCTAYTKASVSAARHVEWLPKDIWPLVMDVVAQLDCRPSTAMPGDDVRGAAVSPAMMTALLVYGYCVGVACAEDREEDYEDVAFRVVPGRIISTHAYQRISPSPLEALAGCLCRCWSWRRRLRW